MKYYNPLLLAVVLWLVPAALFAQEKQPPVVAPPIAGSESDILNPADVIEILVGNHSELDQTAVIGLDGKITLRELGRFVAAGKSRGALQNEIQVAADKTLNNAPVFVTMKEKFLAHITVDGGVAAPGTYQLAPNMKVLDAISAARGLPLKPIRYTATLVRKDKSTPLNVPKIFAEPASADNIVLMADDKLVFNEIDAPRRRVTVLGQIGRPSTYDADSDTNVLTMINQAGGLSPAAALTKVTVTRGSTIIPLNMRPTLIKAEVDKAILAFRFQDGDVLSIPGVETKYQVLGQVNRPASYVYPEQANITVLDALSNAGGPTQMANIKGAVIRRMVNGKPTVIKVNLEGLQKKGLAEANILVQPDDILIIPERGKKGLTINDIFAPLSLLNILGFRLFN